MITDLRVVGRLTFGVDLGPGSVLGSYLIFINTQSWDSMTSILWRKELKVDSHNHFDHLNHRKLCPVGRI